MKALQVSDGQAAIKDIETPLSAGEALVRVIKSGICNTDLEIIRGYAGFKGTIGHEFVGVVERSDSFSLIGKRVVGEINAGCGRCEPCVSGDSRHCATRTVLGIYGRDGAHAEYLTLPDRNLIEIPDHVPDATAVFAEPLAAAYGIFEQVNVSSETRVAVVGDGKLGILCAKAMRLRSDHVTLVGKHREKMALVDGDDIQPVELDEHRDLSRHFDVVIEASGAEGGFATALVLVRPRGKIVLKSTFHGTGRWETSGVVVDEISIIGSRCGRLAPAVELLASNMVQVERLISEDFSLSDGLDAVRAAEKKGAMKVLLSP